jgi:ubiquinone biosynthesis protein
MTRRLIECIVVTARGAKIRRIFVRNMNIFKLVRLLKTIYIDREPDIALIQRLGLLAVKIGQVYALRPDFLGDERCRTLSRLYSNTESLPPEDAVKLIEAYAGAGYLSHFTSFEAKPFASASIGQVHRAVLKTGEQVAVKLVKRDYARNFRRDVNSVRKLFRFAILFYPKLRGVANPVSLLHQIEKMTLDELDLRNEVRGWKQLQEIYECSKGRFDLSRLRFRRVFEELSSENILVSQYAEGPTLDELLNRGELKYASLLELFHLHGFFMFAIGTFHGDIHPGNIVLQGDMFYFLDTGYIGRVPERMRKNLFAFFEALSEDDYKASARCLNAMAERPIEGRVFAGFEKRFLELYADFKGKTVSQVSLTKKMMQTIRLGVVCGMHFDEGMFDIIKSLMYLDGMVIRANPSAVLLKDMRRFIQDFKAVMD